MGFLFKENLSGLKCSMPGCNHEAEIIVSRCHPDAGVNVEANEFGVLTIRCACCKKYVTQIPVTNSQFDAFHESDAWVFIHEPHPNSPLEVNIDIHKGQVKLACIECGADLGYGQVMSQAEWEKSISPAAQLDDPAEDGSDQRCEAEIVEVTTDAVYIHDEHGEEIVCWVQSEWEEDPSIVSSIINAVKIALTEGPEAVRKTINNGGISDEPDDYNPLEFDE